MRCLIVFLLALALFLPFNAQIVITDPVESNYALTAQEMLASGDWLSPRIYGQFWYDKPVMFYWLLMMSYKVFGVTEFAARFPSALLSAASVAFIYWLGCRIFGATRPALYSSAVLATSLEYWVLARAVITDSALFFFLSAALGFMYLGLKGQGKVWFILAYIFSGLAVLTKGPMGILLPGLIVVLFIVVERRWEYIKKMYLWPGLGIFALIALPWFLAMYMEHGSDFVNTFLGLHNFLRATVAEHPKDNVFYYYLVLFPVSLLPWTGVFFRSIIQRKQQDVPFLLVWIVVFIGFFSLVATKYPTYVFPATFPAALLIGWQLEDMATKRQAEWWWLTLPVLLLFCVAAIAAYIFLVPNWLFFAGLFTVCGLAVLVIQLGGWGGFLPKTVVVMIAVLSLSIISMALVPIAQTRSAKEAVALLPKSGAVVASYGDYPTSAAFYSGYTIPSLVENEEEFVSQNVWSGKYTMPKETVAAFSARTLHQPETYLLVINKDEPPVKAVLLGNFGKISLYKRLFSE
ncbi:MAG: hypothetical protein H6Q75_989 [Firmicutes bacterium]|nr:hypothetical protein [Bacillota bacterium]